MFADTVKHKVTVREYVAMFAGQNLTLAPKTELLNGEVFEMSPLGFKHLKTQQLILDFLQKAFSKFDVYPSGSVIANQHNMPEPDILVMKPDEIVENNYPNIDQLAMIAEISDTTLHTDLVNDGNGKLALYAVGGVPLVLVVDIKNKQIQKFTQPKDSKYTEVEILDNRIEINGACESVKNLIA